MKRHREEEEEETLHLCHYVLHLVSCDISVFCAIQKATKQQSSVSINVNFCTHCIPVV